MVRPFRLPPLASLALALALPLGLGACSSSAVAPSAASAPASSEVEPAGGSSTTTTGAAATTAPVGAASAITAPSGDALAQLPGESVADYLKRIGMPDPLIQCYSAALAKMGVTDLHQLEANQSLAAKATSQWEACTKVGAPGTSR